MSLLHLNNLFRHAKTLTAARSLSPSDGIGLDLHRTKTLKSQTSIRTRQNSVWPAPTTPPPLIHTPCPLTPTTICQKLSYKFLFVSIFKHDGEELSLYMRGSLCVYPAAPAPGNKRKPPLLLVEAGKGLRLPGWQEER